MPIEPKTFRESNILIAGIEGRLRLLLWMVAAVVGLVGTLLAGAAALYSQISDVRVQVGVIDTKVGEINKRLDKIDDANKDIRTNLDGALLALERIEGRLTGVGPQQQAPTVPSPPVREISLSDSEIQAVREIMKPIATGEAQYYEVGKPVAQYIVPLLP